MKLSHTNEQGQANMVDISEKSETKRIAVASALISMRQETLKLITEGEIAKGDVLSTARIAGIMASKKTADLIPLCHPLMLHDCHIAFTIHDQSITIESTVITFGRTGVEMEALTAVSVAALTIYDMCKAVDKAMCIERICLEKKSGGKSGEYNRN